MLKCPKCFSELTSCTGMCSCGFHLAKSSAVASIPLTADMSSEIQDLTSMRLHPLWEEVYSTYPDNIKQLILLALEKNDPSVQQQLGFMYWTGDGVEQSHSEAFKWFRQAADQENVGAQCAIGLMYRDGDGVEQSYNEAFKWLHQAAEQGAAIAQCAIGDFYRDGKGCVVERDRSKAFHYFFQAAKQGKAYAQRELGILYRDGDGVEQSYSEAFKWFRQAAERGDACAQRELGLMYCNGDGVESSCVEAYRWLDRATEQEDTIALLSIGYLFAAIADDCAERKHWKKELKWRRLAAAYNDIPSMKRLMDDLLNMDTRRGREEALYWLFQLMIAEDDGAVLTYRQVQRRLDRLEEMEADQDE